MHEFLGDEVFNVGLAVVEEKKEVGKGCSYFSHYFLVGTMGSWAGGRERMRVRKGVPPMGIRRVAEVLLGVRLNLQTPDTGVFTYRT